MISIVLFSSHISPTTRAYNVAISNSHEGEDNEDVADEADVVVVDDDDDDLDDDGDLLLIFFLFGVRKSFFSFSYI